MSDTQAALPPRLQEIVEEFKWAEGSEKLELLLEFAKQMPPLPERFHAAHDGMEQVHECMTPVFVTAELDNGGLHYFFDIPPESPTIRGYAGLLSAGVEGATPEQVVRIPSDFYEDMGLQDVLTPRRLNGVHAMLAYLKRLAQREQAKAANNTARESGN